MRVPIVLELAFLLFIVASAPASSSPPPASIISHQLHHAVEQQLEQAFDSEGDSDCSKNQQQGSIFGCSRVARRVFDCAGGSCSDGLLGNQQKRKSRNYNGYRVFRVNATDRDALDSLVHDFNDNEPQSVTPDVTLDGVTLWRGNAVGDQYYAYIMMPPSKISEFEGYYQEWSGGFLPTVHINDMGSLISSSMSTRSGRAMDTMGWDDYYPFATIEKFVSETAAKMGSLLQSEVIGQSWEGRPIKVLKVATNKNADKAIFIEGGMHAREWISPAVVTYIINEFTNNYCKYKPIIDTYQWHFLPVMNPDGYEYSRTGDRMWRKTRSVRGRTRFGCIGADPNRNFNAHWMTGASPDPCSGVFAGPAPESEKCVMAVRDYIGELQGTPGVRLVGYYSIHSHGQYWLHPPGWTTDDGQIPGLDLLKRVSKVGAEAMRRVHGVEYVVGTPAELLPPPASGSSDDWAFTVAKIPFVFTPELRDNGTHGFLLPPHQIVPTGQEMLAGLLASAEEIHNVMDGGKPVKPSALMSQASIVDSMCAPRTGRRQQRLLSTAPSAGSTAINPSWVGEPTIKILPCCKRSNDKPLL